jgi:hypothetical protein
MTKKEQSSMPERGTLAETNPAVANPVREAKELELKQRQERSRKEQAKLLAELWDAGFRVESVWDFVNTADKYPAAIPILLRHVTLPYSKRIKEGIVRALTVNYAGSEVLHELVRQFREESESRPNSLKWVLGNAIAEAATPADAETVIALATDRSHGESRDAITQRLPRVVKDKARLHEILQLLMRDKQTEQFARLAARGRLY